MDDNKFQFTEFMQPYCSGNLHYPKEISELFSNQEWNEFTLGISHSDRLRINLVKIETRSSFEPAKIIQYGEGINFNSSVGDFITSQVVNSVESATLSTTNVGYMLSRDVNSDGNSYYVELLDTKLSIIQTDLHYKIRINTKIRIRYYRSDPKLGAVDVGEIYPEEQLRIKLEMPRGTLDHAVGKSIHESNVRKVLLIKSDANKFDVRNASLFREKKTFIGYCKAGNGVKFEESKHFHGMTISDVALVDGSEQTQISGKHSAPIRFRGLSLQSIVSKMIGKDKIQFTCYCDTACLGERVIGIREFENDFIEKNYPNMKIQKYTFWAYYDKFGLHIEWSVDVNDLQKNVEGRWEPGVMAGDACIPWEPLILSGLCSRATLNHLKDFAMGK